LFLASFVSAPPPLPSNQLIGQSQPASWAAFSPHQHSSMLPLRDFVATLARARKSFKDIQETVAVVSGNKSLKKMQIYAII
jgi:hypothetical protein